VAGIIELNQLFINNRPDGTMDLDDLRQRLVKLQKYQHVNFVISANFGTTCLAGFDNVLEIRRIFDELKNEGWNYTVNLDMAMYGPTLPILKQFGE
jgi:glutamate/tyrosine decarboxylase-like PLP-dependent enzyme